MHTCLLVNNSFIGFKITKVNVITWKPYKAIVIKTLNNIYLNIFICSRRLAQIVISAKQL